MEILAPVALILGIIAALIAIIQGFVYLSRVFLGWYHSRKNRNNKKEKKKAPWGDDQAPPTTPVVAA